MTDSILTQLNDKITFAVETIQHLEMQLAEQEHIYSNLKNQNTQLNEKLTDWEKTLQQMADKLTNFDQKITEKLDAVEQVA